MVLRDCEGRVGALAAVCLAAAGFALVLFPNAHDVARAQSRFDAPIPPGNIPGDAGPGGMVWGGRLPTPGEAYVPSRSVRDGASSDFGTSRTVAPPATGSAALQHRAPQFPAPIAPQVDPPIRSSSASATDSLLRDLIGGGASPQPLSSPAARSRTLPAPPGTVAEPPAIFEAGRNEASTPILRDDDLWDGLKAVTPGAAPNFNRAPSPRPSRVAPRSGARGVIASIDPQPGPERPATAVPGRGALVPQTPPGYVALPRAEAMCRRALSQLGVRFTELDPIGSSRGCGIAHPIRITQIADGVAMVPAATLNCGAAVRISKWVADEVKPAARWRLWTSPTAVLNASSYRCSRIAGSRTVSEHASGNALDVRGFTFSNGDVFDVEKKGFFSFRQKGFQKSVRHSACEHFGTVLGPGYNYDHRDHLHLDAKNRRRVVCK